MNVQIMERKKARTATASIGLSKHWIKSNKFSAHLFILKRRESACDVRVKIFIRLPSRNRKPFDFGAAGDSDWNIGMSPVGRFCIFQIHIDSFNDFFSFRLTVNQRQMFIACTPKNKWNEKKIEEKWKKSTDLRDSKRKV